MEVRAEAVVVAVDEEASKGEDLVASEVHDPSVVPAGVGGRWGAVEHQGPISEEETPKAPGLTTW